MDPKAKRLVDRVKAHLRETYGESIRRVILYGSYARGEATEDSDVDVLAVVDSSLDPCEVEDSLNEGELVSVIAVTEERFESYRSPFMLNVKKEGITA